MGIETEGNPEHKWQYNGKEKIEELGLNQLDYGARMYDPLLGKWHVIDPLTDEQETWSPYHYTYNNPVNYVDLYGLSPSNAFESTSIAICPTCPNDKKYDEYRNNKSLYTYDKETGIVLNGDGKGATVYGKRNQEPTFKGWGHLFGPSIIVPAAEFPKIWIGKATVGNASEVTTSISYLSNKLLGNERMQKFFNYSNVMSKRLYTHSRIINGKVVRFKTNLLGRYVGRCLGFGLSRASMAVTVYDIVDTANTNFQNMALEEQHQLLQTQQMSGSFIPKELLQEQRDAVKKQFNNER